MLRRGDTSRTGHPFYWRVFYHSYWYLTIVQKSTVRTNILNMKPDREEIDCAVVQKIRNLESRATAS